MTNVINTTIIVLIIAGIILTLSVLYSHSNKDGFKFGTPRIKI